ncbi:MAG: hypothetical protein ACREA9_25235, partial [Pyrinomonadaceae bacterium]
RLGIVVDNRSGVPEFDESMRDFIRESDHLEKRADTPGLKDARDVVPVSIYISGSQKDGEKLQEAVLRAGDLYGFEIAHKLGAEVGSWFSRIRLRSKNFLNSSETQKRLKNLESALELEVLDKRRAEVDRAKAEAIGSIIGQIAGQSNAVVRIGSLVIVKMDDNIWAETIDEASARQLEENSTILKSPTDAVRFFGLDAASKQLSCGGDFVEKVERLNREGTYNHKGDADQLPPKKGPEGIAAKSAESG